MSFWVVRAGNDREQEAEALKNNVISIFWDLPDLSNFQDKDSLKEAYVAAYPNEKKTQIRVSCAQIWSFVREIQKGDRVAIPLKTRRQVAIGKVVGDYEYQNLAPNVQHIRRVDSFKAISRSEVPANVSRKLNVHQTVQKIESVSVQQWFLENVGDKEYEDLILAYARVSKKIAKGTLKVGHISLEMEMESRAFLKKRVQEFLETPTNELFESFWTPPYVYSTVRGGSAAALLEKNWIREIARILRIMSSSSRYNPDWETRLGAKAALWEFWGKIRGQPVGSSCAGVGLAFFGYSGSATHAAFLDAYLGFKRYYRKIIGEDSATKFPIDVELDQLFNFLDKAKDGDVDSKIDDVDVQALYLNAGKKKSEKDDPRDAKRRYWVELTDVKGHPDREEGPYKLGAALWCPQLSSTEQTYYAYENVKEVRSGDVILHLPDREGFSGVSIAASSADSSFVCPKGTRYEGKKWYLVHLRDYEELDEPFRRTSFLEGSVYEQLKALHGRYGQLFFHKEDGNLTQGAYLTEAPVELVHILNQAYEQETQHNLPHLEHIKELFELYNDIITTYGGIANRIVEGDLQYSQLDVAARNQKVEELRELLNAFLAHPTESTLKSFWNTKYIAMTTTGGSAIVLLKKIEPRQIQEVLLELRDTEVYDEGWERKLGAHWPLQELWGKLHGKSANANSWTGLYFFNMPSRSFSDFQVQFAQFLDFYQKVLGKEKATPFPIGVEIEQLFHFIYAIRNKIVVSADIDQLDDQDVTRLYDKVLKVYDLMRGPEQQSEKPIKTTRETGGEYQVHGPRNFMFYGPPGTGKTYEAINLALEIIHGDPEYSDGRDQREIKREFKQLRKEHRIRFVTFHQAYSYEEFIEGIRPVLDEDNIKYTLSEGVFKQVARWAREGKSNGNYVLIIDEINRGNISKIFGELITLIEDDKREGEKNEISTTLPYSQEEFSVPSNLFIIGTMNTADRSIALMDVALRRRFMFEEFMPDSRAAGLHKCTVGGLNLGGLLQALNERIKILVDRDHQIGHSFFIKVKDEQNELERKKMLSTVWHYELVPLFQEYFYNDYEKLKQLLGKYEIKDGVERGFIEEIRKGEIERIIGTGEGVISEIFVGSIHDYTDPDALIIALKQYVSKAYSAL